MFIKYGTNDENYYDEIYSSDDNYAKSNQIIKNLLSIKTDKFYMNMNCGAYLYMNQKIKVSKDWPNEDGLIGTINNKEIFLQKEWI